MPEIEEERGSSVLDSMNFIASSVSRSVMYSPGGPSVMVPKSASRPCLRSFRARAGRHRERSIRSAVRRWACMERDVETLLFRPIRLGQSQVPFADMTRAIARVAQSLGQRVLRRVEIGLAFRHEQVATRRRGLRKVILLRRRWPLALVMPCRDAYWPLRMEALVGENSGSA